MGSTSGRNAGKALSFRLMSVTRLEEFPATTRHRQAKLRVKSVRMSTIDTRRRKGGVYFWTIWSMGSECFMASLGLSFKDRRED